MQTTDQKYRPFLSYWRNDIRYVTSQKILKIHLDCDYPFDKSSALYGCSYIYAAPTFILPSHLWLLSYSLGFPQCSCCSLLSNSLNSLFAHSAVSLQSQVKQFVVFQLPPILLVRVTSAFISAKKINKIKNKRAEKSIL